MIPKTNVEGKNMAFFQYEDGKLIVGFNRRTKGDEEPQVDVYEHTANNEDEQLDMDDQAKEMLRLHNEGESVGSYFQSNIRGRYTATKVTPKGDGGE